MITTWWVDTWRKSDSLIRRTVAGSLRIQPSPVGRLRFQTARGETAVSTVIRLAGSQYLHAEDHDKNVRCRADDTQCTPVSDVVRLQGHHSQSEAKVEPQKGTGECPPEGPNQLRQVHEHSGSGAGLTETNYEPAERQDPESLGERHGKRSDDKDEAAGEQDDPAAKPVRQQAENYRAQGPAEEQHGVGEPRQEPTVAHQIPLEVKGASVRHRGNGAFLSAPRGVVSILSPSAVIAQNGEIRAQIS